VDASNQESEQRRDPIVGGQATTGYPAVGELTHSGKRHCTGTIVAKRTVVTAAHCVAGYSASSMRFALGSTVSSTTAVIGVASMQAPPNYDPVALTNDIGIVTLSSDAPVSPMQMISSLDPSWVGKSLVFVGFGENNGVSETGSGIKRVVSMPITS